MMPTQSPCRRPISSMALASTLLRSASWPYEIRTDCHGNITHGRSPNEVACSSIKLPSVFDHKAGSLGPWTMARFGSMMALNKNDRGFPRYEEVIENLLLLFCRITYLFGLVQILLNTVGAGPLRGSMAYPSSPRASDRSCLSHMVSIHPKNYSSWTFLVINSEPRDTVAEFNSLWHRICIRHSMATESSYPTLSAKLDLRGEQFRANKDSWVPVLEKFEDALKQVSAEGNDVSLRRHQTRGQLLRMFTPGEKHSKSDTINSKRSRRIAVGSGFAFSRIRCFCWI